MNCLLFIIVPNLVNIQNRHLVLSTLSNHVLLVVFERIDIIEALGPYTSIQRECRVLFYLSSIILFIHFLCEL